MLQDGPDAGIGIGHLIVDRQHDGYLWPQLVRRLLPLEQILVVEALRKRQHAPFRIFAANVEISRDPVAPAFRKVKSGGPEGMAEGVLEIMHHLAFSGALRRQKAHIFVVDVPGKL